MKLDVSKVLTTIKGEPFLIDEKGIKREGKLSEFLKQCLNFPVDKENAEMSAKRFKIMRKILEPNDGLVELEIEEIAMMINLVKGFVPGGWNIEMIGRVCEYLESEAVIK